MLDDDNNVAALPCGRVDIEVTVTDLHVDSDSARGDIVRRGEEGQGKELLKNVGLCWVLLGRSEDVGKHSSTACSSGAVVPEVADFG